MRGRIFGAAGAVLIAMFVAAPAMADSLTLTFTRIGGVGNSPEASTDPELSVVVSDDGVDPGYVRFTFLNHVHGSSGERLSAGDAGYSSIAEVYFDDGTLLGLSDVWNDPDFTDFEGGSANPGNLPGGETVIPPFEATAGFVADINTGGPTQGVDYVDEEMSIIFELIDGMTFADVVAALGIGGGEGGLRIGLHVISIGENEESASFVNGPPPVIPTPAAALGGLALMGLVAFRRRSLNA